MSERITMKQVAAEAGVSQATVSLSLSNHPRIPAATRTRVQSVAHRLDYRPNPLLSVLMRNRRRRRPLPAAPVLALVCAYDRADGWRNAPALTVRHILQGALAQAEARGYQGQEVWLRKDGMSDERCSEVLRARGIQGALLGPLAPGAPLPAMRWDDFSVVRVGVPRSDLPLRSVCHDNYSSGLLAVRECLRLGYRRPGLVLLRSHNRNLEHRWEAGFLAGIQELPPARRLAPLVVEDWPPPPVLSRWLQACRPDVVITPGHEQVQRSLAALDLRAPRDLGLVSLACRGGDDPVSGINQNGRLIGASAVDLLIDLVERHERGLPLQSTGLMLQGQWNPGRTLPAARPESGARRPA